MIGIFLQSFLGAFSGAVVPGPLFAITVQQGLSVGWTAGFWLIVGHMITELLLLLLLRAGLGGLLQRPLTTRLVGLLGGAVLLYFAWGMIAVIFAPDLSGAAPHGAAAPLSMLRLVGQGFLLSVTGPYWILWWATVGVGLVGTQVRAHGRQAWPVFFIGHELADFVWYTLVSTVVAISGSFLGPTMHRGIIFVAGIAIAVLGIYLIYRQLPGCAGHGNRPVAPPTETTLESSVRH